jgi:hypothetical protein
MKLKGGLEWRGLQSADWDPFTKPCLLAVGTNLHPPHSLLNAQTPRQGKNFPEMKTPSNPPSLQQHLGKGLTFR